MNNISTNAADFSRSLMAMSVYIDGSIEKVLRKACIDLYRAIAEKTPVDTGRAKASWSLSTHYADDKATEAEYSYNEVKQIIKDNVSGFKFSVHDGQVVIYNNMEYIDILESGTGSEQAPNGMVSISLVEFTAFFNNALHELGGDGIS